MIGKKVYIAVVADIIKSRDIVERNELQQRINKTFDEINNGTISIVSPFTLTLGDEFQAVFKSSNDFFLSILKIIDTIFPNELRIGVGIDTLTTDINRNSALGMDGPAFHLAREAIVKLKETSSYFNISTKSGKYDKLISASLNVIIGEIYKYKKSNRTKLFIARLLNMTFSQIAEKENISRQAVNKNNMAWMVDDKVSQIKEIENLLQEKLCMQ